MKDARDILSFNALYANYNERFVRFARTYVSVNEVAEDIVVESLIYYWENRLSLAVDSNIPVYLLTVIKHKCLNYLHRMRTREEIEEYLTKTEAWELNLRIATLDVCNPEKLFSDEVQNIVDQTLATLPKQTREIFIRSRFNNESHKEIADSLGLSTKSIEYHITKTLKILRVGLKDYFPLLLLTHRFIDV